MLSLNPSSKGHHFGNFHNYYEFHETLSRITVILEGVVVKIWRALDCPDTFTILDIGCNEGNLTAEMLRLVQQQLPETVTVVAVGIDIDDALIERARLKYADTTMKFYTVNCMVPAEVTSFINSISIPTFSIVCAYSITMWIHMNFGDTGLNDFLVLLGTLSANAVIVEPQKWKSYRNAMQRCRRLKIAELPYYQSLKIHSVEEECVRVLSETFAMKEMQRIQCTEWGRELLILCKLDEK